MREKIRKIQKPEIWTIKVYIMGIFNITMISYLFYENILYSIILTPYLYYYVKQKQNERSERKAQEFENQFKDGMTAVSFALSAGYSIENAFKEAVKELALLYNQESGIIKDFKKIIYQLGINKNIEDIFEEFAAQSKNEDVLYFAEVLRYAKRSGGNLVLIIKRTIHTITQKIEVNREIHTMMSGKKMEQKIMSIIPFAIILYLKFSAPEFIEPLYGNAAGVIIMTICFGLYILADILARNIIRIEI